MSLKVKKIKLKGPKCTESAGATTPLESSSSSTKLTLKVPSVTKGLEPFPCCLCISREETGLLRVHDIPGPWTGCQINLPKDASGNPIWQAHESCALIIPETWVDQVCDNGDDDEAVKMVFGVDAIVKDRWNLVSNAE